jgi:hypothetical protein
VLKSKTKHQHLINNNFLTLELIPQLFTFLNHKIQTQMKNILFIVSIIGMMMFTACNSSEKAIQPAIEISAIHYNEKADTIVKTARKAVLVIETELSTFEKIEIDTTLFSLYEIGQKVTVQEILFTNTGTSHYAVLTNWVDLQNGIEDLYVTEFTKGKIRKKLWI